MKTSSRVAYLRASTHNQDFDMQRSELERSFGKDLKQATWMEETCSGAKDSRPHYDELKKGIQKGTVKDVYVYAFDRIARSVRELLSFVEICHRHQCSIHCAKTPLDLSGLSGKIVLTVLGLCAEIEREMITRRLKDGLRRKMAKEGWRAGGHAIGWFSKKVLAKVPAILSLHKDGHSIRAICRATGVNERTVKNVLAAKPEDLITAAEARKLRPVHYRQQSNPDAYSK